MNAISLTRHLLLKDLRHQRTSLALVWAVALLMPLAASALFATGREWISMSMLPFGLFFLVFIVLAQVILLDPPGRGLHFLVTRPVPWQALLGSKILFIALFLLLPVWIAKLGIIFLLRIPVGATDIALVLLENAVRAGVLLAVVMFFSMFLRGVSRVFAALVTGAIAVGIGYVWYDRIRGGLYRNTVLRMPDPTLEECRHLMFYLVIIGAVGLAAAFRYRRKSLLATLGVAAAGLAFGALAWNCWSFDMSRLFPDRPRNTGELPSPLRDRIKFALVAEDTPGAVDAIQVGTDMSFAVTIRHAVTLEGLEPPYFATLADYHAVAVLKSGRTISSAFNDINAHGLTGGVTEDLQRQVVGLEPARKRNWSEAGFEIFNYIPTQYQKEDLGGAAIKGVITLEIHRLLIVKTAPFKVGTSADMPRRRYITQDIEIKRAGIDYKILTPSVASTLRGDTTGFMDWEDFSWLVYNPGERYYMSLGSRGRNGGEGILYNVLVHEGSLDATWGDPRTVRLPVPASWLDGAQITFFTSESCGRISFPYEIKSVDLKR